ncbi:hypothetical protein CEXT_583171 [Caerostris extrusa]|uniref:Uncharacterized protein n=1 Tax=Caerostris extrusa TaxID=172846 RepID=A0AAV4NJD2_CAEEX|nr:hypothetical protein CEXT_583171 [Caerostris extrusa]
METLSDNKAQPSNLYTTRKTQLIYHIFLLIFSQNSSKLWRPLNRITESIVNASGATAKFIKNDLPYHPIFTPPLQHIETTITSLSLPNLDPIIMVYYIPDFSDTHLFPLDLEISMQLGSDILKCCDFSADHQVWNSANNRPIGSQLLKFPNKQISMPLHWLPRQDLVSTKVPLKTYFNQELPVPFCYCFFARIEI